MQKFLIVCAATVLTGCTAGGQNATAPSPSARHVAFVCDKGQALSVDFSEGRALLEAEGLSVELTQQIAASGIHYQGSGHDLRGKGPDMTWTDSTGAIHQCRDREVPMRQSELAQQGSPLAGTSWRLVHFQSSDDAIGTVIPPNVQDYTLQFMNDGTLAMRLDCNRANARWEARPSSTSGGALTISPAAMTRAMCGPNAMDVRLAQDTTRVRSYTLRDGQLSLALEADAGIYLWEPIPR